mgnify:CR=1 FL=1
MTNKLSYSFVVPMSLAFFVSSSVSETTTCGGFSVIGELLETQDDSSLKEILNTTCELESQDE